MWLNACLQDVKGATISIHTPHTRCDCRNSSARQLAHIISIHTPHTRCDRCYHSSLVPPCISIHTPHTRCDLYCSCHFHCFLVISIHTPHTRCDRQWRSNRLVYLYFNPHTSYEVWQAKLNRFFSNALKFQSTHLIRGVTPIRYLMRSWSPISIHTPHTRCDDELRFILYPLK